MKTGIITAVLMAASLNCGAAGSIESRVDSLLNLMTLEEKVGQLSQYTGAGYAPYMVSAIKEAKVGSILNEVDPATINKLQKDAVENTRLGIPLVFARDVIHGFKTIFPIPLGQAATWNPQLVEKGSALTAREAASAGVRWTFSPMVDIARDGRWGRIAEGYGEDPVLTGAMGVAAVKGYQGDDLSKPGTMAACVKHFACYGAAEGGRDYNTTWIPMELLHDVYLPPFEAAAKAGAATFMCSFNDINGLPSSGNSYLMRDILRDKWGWRGLMVSDWNSITEMINHGYCEDKRDAALKGALAGVDMDMEGHSYDANLADLVREGLVSEEVLDEMVRNVLRLKFRLGLFENPYVDMSTANTFYTPEALESARQTVEESAILLKNNGILPLQGKKRIFVTGPMADAQHDQNGTWCFDLEKSRTITPLVSLKEKYGKAVSYEPGLTYSRDKTSDFSKALAAAAKSDVILYFAGEEAVLSGEAHSRADLTLPGAQKEYLQALAATGVPVVTIVMAGRPLAIPDVCGLSSGVIYLFHPGTMGGPAIANLLGGEANPGGKLPVCLPVMSGQEPLYYARKNTSRPTEQVVVMDEIPLEAGQTSTGCTTMYLDAGLEPLYPFGYGMSYTDFTISEPRLSATEMAADGSITVSCDITNTGGKAGSEVAQLYVRDLVASLSRPLKEMKAFEKVTLQPGQTQTVAFTLPASALAFHNSRGESIVEPGRFLLWVDNSSACKTNPIEFIVK